MPLSSIRRGQLAGLLAAVLFGCSAPLIRTRTDAGSALSIAGLLYAGAALALLAVRLIKGGAQAETPGQRKDRPALACLKLLGGVVGPLALVLGLARLSAASTSLLLHLEGMFTVAIVVAAGREHLGRRGVFSAVLTIAGALLLSDGSLRGAAWPGASLIATLKAAGASLPMLSVALLLGERFPPSAVIGGLLGIGALGYGISIWLDLLAHRDLGAA
jgi:drug/metabolite transporter (DMT)-like permease